MKTKIRKILEAHLGNIIRSYAKGEDYLESLSNDLNSELRWAELKDFLKALAFIITIIMNLAVIGFIIFMLYQFNILNNLK